MEGFLKLSTAVNITVLMIDSSDHVTGKTGLTLTIYATKAAGTPAAITPTVTELDSTNVKGVYKLALTTGHTDTLGELQLHITSSGADPTDVKFQVSTYLPGEAATLQADQAVNATKIGGTSQTGRDIGASVLLSSGTGTGQLDFTSGVVKANLAQILGTALTETAGQIAAAFKKFFNIATPASTMDALTLVATATNLTNAPTAGDFTSTMKTSIGTAVAASAVASVTGNVGGNVTGSVGSVTGLTASDVGAIKAKTDNLPSDPADESLIIAATDAIMNRVGAPVGASISADVAAVKTDTGAIKTKTDNLPASPAAVSDIPTAAENADAVWDETLADHQGVGSTGEALDGAGGSGSAPTAAEVANAVWDAVLADHLTSGSTGEALNGAGASGNPWIAVLEGGYTAEDLLRFCASVAAGKTNIVKTGTDRATVTFRDVSDGSDLIVATMHKSNRTGVTLNP